MRPLRPLFAALLVCCAVSCNAVLALDDYTAGSKCVAAGPLACLVSKCEASKSRYVVGVDPLQGNYADAACPEYPACLCSCTDSTCAKACGSQCSGGASTSLYSSCAAAAADCDL